MINKSEKGAPTLTLSGGCLERLHEIMPQDYAPDIHLSLSDEYPYASAYVVLAAKPLHPIS